MKFITKQELAVLPWMLALLFFLTTLSLIFNG